MSYSPREKQEALFEQDMAIVASGLTAGKVALGRDTCIPFYVWLVLLGLLVVLFCFLVGV